MADNIAVTPGAGASVAADDIGGVLYQRVKIGVGADGTAVDVSAAAPLPISDAGGSITIDAASLPLPAGATTEATLAAQSAKLPATLGQKAMTASMAVTIASDQSTTPNSLETNSLFAGATALTPKFAAISASSSGNNTLIAAVAGKKIRVLSYTLVCTTAATAKFQSGAGGTDLCGAMPFGANGGVSVPFNPLGHFETAVNTLLNLSIGSAVQVSGHLCYVEV